ncbi:MAG: hypothetical protein KGJ86_04015, partial [Chloroflexota bacterium]|nr:hypothetical protein [Chloroflexota bacterium]
NGSAMQMGSEFDEVRRRHADLLARAAGVYGLSPLFGRLYSTLLLAPQPMTLDQLAQAAGAAKSTVSVALRNLERYQVARREWVRGDRRDFYVARTDFAAIMQDWYRLFFQHEIRYVQQANSEVREFLSSVEHPERASEQPSAWPTAAERDVILQRMDEADRLIAVFQDWFDEILPAMSQGERLPAAQIPIQVER